MGNGRDKTVQPEKQVVLHPILFALYPSAFLYAANLKLLDFPVVFAPIIITTTIAGLLWLALRRITGDLKLAAVFTSLPLLAFFSYGALTSVVGSSTSNTWSIIISVCLAVACISALALLKWRHYLEQTTYILNIISLLLVAAPALQAAIWGYSVFVARGNLPDRTEFNIRPPSLKAPPAAPDIYYFILDGYGRDDVLRDDYDFDNTKFITGLQQRGFYIADEAVSNYAYTLASLTSTMNMAYLQGIVGDGLGANPDRRFLREVMANNRTVQWLRSVGYSTVSFMSEYSEAQIGDVDVDLSRWWFPSQYVQAMSLMTPIPDALDALGRPGLYDLHRYRTLYPFERMSDAAALDGPKLVYTHVFFGHPPFVFGPNGERISKSADYTWDDGSRLLDGDSEERKEYVEGYVSQVSYLNGRLEEVIDDILAKSARPPIIVMHGDHGPGARYHSESLERTDVRERFSIFYAALLPDGGAEDLYPTISPLNGLRIVFNRYFDANIPLLEDEIYFSGFETPYIYTSVDPDELRRRPSEPDEIDQENVD